MDYLRYQGVSSQANKLSAETIRLIKSLKLAPNPIHYLVLCEALCFREDEVSKSVLQHLEAHSYDDFKAGIFFNQLMKQSCFERITNQEYENIFADLKQSISHWMVKFPEKHRKFEELFQILEEPSEDIPTDFLQKNIASYLSEHQQDNLLLFEKVEASEKRLRALENDLHSMTQIAMTDELTGLLNRRGLQKQYTQICNPKTPLDFELAVLVIDIDFFKKFNDQYGHLVGDSALRFISRYLQQETKRKDVLARFGGEEFVVMLPDTDYSQALSFAEKLRKIIETKKLVIAKSGQEISLTISVGVASREECENYDDLFEKADQALYQAKKNGRNQVVGYKAL